MTTVDTLALDIVHPALSGQFQYMNAPDTDFSTEFINFIVSWGSGNIGNSPWHYKWFEVCTRKGCFGDILIDPLGQFTYNGQLFFEVTKAMEFQLIDYYRNRGQTRAMLQDPTPALHLHDILVKAKLDLGVISILKTLYILKNEETSKLKEMLLVSSMMQPMPVTDSKWLGSAFFEPKTGETQSCLLTSALRNNPKDRKRIDKLLRTGLAQIIRLPRFPAQKGRGRPPVGVIITNWGEKFFELYLEQYDEQLIKDRQSRAVAQEMFEEDNLRRLENMNTTPEPPTFGQNLASTQNPPIAYVPRPLAASLPKMPNPTKEIERHPIDEILWNESGEIIEKE